MKWWLISNETADEVRRALGAAQASLGTPLVTTYKDALHSMESGLHETETVPTLAGQGSGSNLRSP